MIFKGKNEEYLALTDLSSVNQTLLEQTISEGLSIVWFTEGENFITIDGVECCFGKNQIITLTEFNSIHVKKIVRARLVQFNRPFYCIIHNDSEVGCKGLLFFGAHQLPILHLPATEEDKFSILWRMFEIEMHSTDSLQVEMLQMMLKRLLILCTRLYKDQNELSAIASPTIDLIREFNILIETHFRTHHTVSAYANLLHKSPKTLSNIFSKMYQKSPLQFIQERLILEAKRLLLYTDKPVKEIGYEIGFEDIQSFSRFFKSKEKISPSEYREKML